MQSLRRVLAVVVVAAGLVLAIPAVPARAQAFEQLLDYTVDLQIEADGTLLVTEQIAYDFGTEERHGIFRDVPVRFRYDDRYDRVYPLQVLEVSGSPGTPGEYALEDVDNKLRIRIGDPDQTISGRHDYTITYRVEGTLNGFPDHDELYWNAIGTDWEVPIGQASVTVRGPAAIGRVACYVGPAGSDQSCASSGIDGRTASFAATGLGPYEGVTVVVGFPTEVVPAPQPVLEERRSLARAFAVTPGTLAMAGGVLVVVLVVLGWLFGIIGRNRQRGAGPGSVADAVVGSVPPEGIRPAQAGLLLDEVVNPVVISATVVDLAVRGYLRIEEGPTREEWDKPDWRLVKLKPADNTLLEYERRLLDGLFAASHRHADDAEAVWLSELPTDFYHQFNSVRSSLYRDAMKRRWFTEPPEKVRERWFTRGVGVTALSVVLTVLVAWLTSYGLVTIPILLAGLMLMVGAKRMPRHTPAGAELLRRVNGFRAYLAAAGADRPDPTQDPDQFSPYLPYAIVFGLTDQWTGAFTLVGAPPRTPWYASRQPYEPLRFRQRIHHFSSSSAETLTASPPAVTGSSGFGWGPLTPRAAAVAVVGAAPRRRWWRWWRRLLVSTTSRARPIHCRRRAEHRRPADKRLQPGRQQPVGHPRRWAATARQGCRLRIAFSSTSIRGRYPGRQPVVGPGTGRPRRGRSWRSAQRRRPVAQR